MKNFAMPPARSLSRETFWRRAFTVPFWVSALFLPLLGRPVLAQPPGSAAAEKIIRADYAADSGPDWKQDLENIISKAAPNFTASYDGGQAVSRAQWLIVVREYEIEMGPTNQEHQVVRLLRWTGNEALFELDDDYTTYLHRWGLNNIYEEQSVSFDTWIRVAGVWKMLHTNMTQDRTWIDGQLQR